MALIECPECKKQVSSTATTCINCGFTIPKKTEEPSIGCYFGCFGVLFLIYLMFSGCLSSLDGGDTKQGKTEVVYNSSWDGSVWQADKYLKKIAKDPDSIEYVGWTPVKKITGGFQVGVSYRAKNSFGAKVLENRLIKFDSAGNVISCE